MTEDSSEDSSETLDRESPEEHLRNALVVIDARRRLVLSALNQLEQEAKRDA
jgi:hypothetical protein